MRILVVDDDVNACRVVCIGLEAAGMEAEAVSTAEDALDLLRERAPGTFDLILLDVGLPGLDGLGFLEELRAAREDVPVICLSARKTLEDKLRGLAHGADDYVVKPFEFEELVARIEAVARRRRSTLRVGSLFLDVDRRKVRRADRPVELSPREFDLLYALARGKGEVLSRERILREVWDMDFDPGTNLLDVHLGRLRRKLDRHGPPAIRTVRGEGYRLATENLTPT